MSLKKNLARIGAAIGCCLGWLCCLAGCEQAGSAGQVDAIVDYQQRAKELTKATGLPTRVSPKAVALTSHYNFGTMDPMTIGVHKFYVRNDGGAPLRLLLLDSSCKCTVGKVEDDEIPPGGMGEVEMEWNTGNQVAYYKQWARIATNASDDAELTFHIEGVVRQDIRFEPEAFEFGQSHPTESQQRSLLLFSQTLDDFEVEKVSPSRAGFEFSLAPASAEELAAHQARKGYRVTVQSPTDLTKGNYQEYLDFAIKLRPEGTKASNYSILLRGRVLGRLAVFGQGIDELGYLHLGTLTYGKGATAKLKVQVRDQDPELTVKRIHVEPDFLQAELTKSRGVSVDSLYDLRVSVPQDAPPCAHKGDAAGLVRIEFDHPRIPQLTLKVLVSIRPLEELR